MRAWLGSERGRFWLFATASYLTLLAVYAAVAGGERLLHHTPYNHFALLAEAWLRGHLDLGGSPPDYAQGNDFALYAGKWYVPFPALPALLILPLVYLAGDAEIVRDAQFFVWLAPLGPVLLFAALERYRALGRSPRTRVENLLLMLSFALGSVYFFTAVQGSVWFAAHVVAVAFTGAYVFFSVDARSPWLAGLMLGLAYWSRAPLLFAAPLFLLESMRASTRPEVAAVQAGTWSRLWRFAARIDARRWARLAVPFAVPLALCFGLSLWHNAARFDDPFDVGYRHLQIAWSGRIDKWGLFHYHYLAKNLGVVLTSMPWVEPFRINAHGLALWITTPVYLYLLWPKAQRPGYRALLLTAAAVGVPELFYQNTGWMQFGYRFSNDYAVFLFVALALSRPRFGPLFWLFTGWALVVNAFGAVTFDRPEYAKLYYQQPSQTHLYQPD